MQTTHHQVPNLQIQNLFQHYVIFREWAYRSSPGWTQCRPRSSQYHLSTMQEPYSNCGWCSTFWYSLGPGYFTLHVWMYLLCLHSLLHIWFGWCGTFMSKLQEVYWKVQGKIVRFSIKDTEAFLSAFQTLWWLDAKAFCYITTKEEHFTSSFVQIE